MSSGDPQDDRLDDPRLTAHAMGEAEGPLTPGEQAEVDAIRATADALRAGFAATPMPVLDPAHRAAILQGLSGADQGLSPDAAKPHRGAVPGSVVRMSEYSGLGALAATLLLVVGLGIAGATGGVGLGGGGVPVKSFRAGDLLNVVDGDLDGIGEFGSFISTVGYVGPRASSGRGFGGAGGAGGAVGGIQPTTRKLQYKPAFGYGVVGGGGGGGGGGGAMLIKSAGDLARDATREKERFGRWKLDDVTNGMKDGSSSFDGGAGGDYRARVESVFERTRKLEAGLGESKADTYLAFHANPSMADLQKDIVRLKAETRRLLASGSVTNQADAELNLFVQDMDSAITGGADDENQALVVNAKKLRATTQKFLDALDRGGFIAETASENPTEDAATESFLAIVENPWIRPYGEAALSTFSIDVDTAGYSIVRRSLLEQNRLPPPGALRVEELVNYFPYSYAGPVSADPFAVHVDAAACPWTPGHRLVRIALKGREVEEALRPAANLVFLLDVSGSMQPENKLPLVRKSIEMLTERLTARDRVAMVVYAGQSGLVLPSTAAGDHAPILEALGRLGAGGSTNGGAGIELAYKVAAENFVPGGINRVVLATDGDFNVGVSDPSALVKMVEEKAKSGVFLTALGYGMDNLKDSTLEQLADKGNGNYGYIDTLAEARKVLVEQGMSTLHCIAKDMKIQVEFNPAKVAGYRLLGYENRMLAAQDFADDAKDAGEIGAGHTVTALYEVVPAGVEVPGAPVDELRYQRPGAFSGNAETLVVKLRWKEPEGTVSTPREFPFVDAGLSFDSGSDDFRFAAAVAAFGMVLRGSKCAGSANLDLVREIAAGARGADAGGYRAEFVTLVEKARALKK